MKEETMSICGMVCRPCETAVAAGLLSLPGVASAKPDYVHARVDLVYDESICTREEVEARLASIGYPPGRPVSGAVYDLITLACVMALFFALQMLPHAPLAEEGTAAAGLFVLGLGTGVHCIAMCGGLMLTQTMRASLPLDAAASGRSTRSEGNGGEAGKAVFNGRGAWSEIRAAFARSVTYNAARFASCAAVGALLGGLGAVFAYPIWLKGLLLTAAGMFVMLFGLSLSGFIRPPKGLRALKPCSSDAPEAKSSPAAPPSRSRGSCSGNPFGTIIVGGLNGFMPCGALIAVWLVAASSGSAVSGAASMMAFCAGTLPLMIAFGGAAHLIPARHMKYALHGSAVVATALGLSLALAGLRLF